MAYVVRDPRFSMSHTDPEMPMPIVHFPRRTYARQIERRLISLWKLMTRNGRKQPRNSFISRDFINVTSRRRSTYHPQLQVGQY
ncbi:hypothetical protein CPB83DRAFT_851000 [Crepidotus variabilis]|uniref:Uncharacterized protein n=1 Tax=Crepidotus variabilis TaxID=179855 RepID=A0A9P6EJY7_9AGAR|nr:hypothetical protein CPB83DRAFT_851000 [Crepidotus variabilis]